MSCCAVLGQGAGIAAALSVHAGTELACGRHRRHSERTRPPGRALRVGLRMRRAIHEPRSRSRSRHDHDHGAALRAGARHVKPLVDLVRADRLRSPWCRSSSASSPTLWPCCPMPGTWPPTRSGSGMALAAIQAASNARAHPQRTFGLYRLEILAALFNAMLLFAVAGYVLFEAVRRIDDAPEIASRPGADRRRASASCVNVDRVHAAARRRQGEPQRARRVSRGGVRHDRIRRRDRRRGGLGHHRLDVGRPDDRRGHRRVHPSSSVAPRSRGAARAGAGGAGTTRHPGAARRTRQRSPASSTCTTSTCGR